MIDLKLVLILSPMLSSTVMFSYWIRLYLLKKKKSNVEKTDIQKIFKQTLLLFSIAIPSDLWNTHYLYGTNDLEKAYPEVRTLELIDSVALYSCITNLTWIGRKVCPYLWKDQESLLRPTPENFEERLEYCFNDSSWRKKDRVCKSAVNGELKNKNKELKVKYFKHRYKKISKKFCGKKSAEIEKIIKDFDLLEVGGPILAKECFEQICPLLCNSLLSEYLFSLNIPYAQTKDEGLKRGIIEEGTSLVYYFSLSIDKRNQYLSTYNRMIRNNYPDSSERKILKEGVKKFIKKHFQKHYSQIDFSIYD
ncbi:MAG: hypothetical protein NXH75_03525 [Halobacteriovoraceae bacterium]|nr:hypothetical protein [Halobacteriovoraceae bacterium]